MLTSFLGRGRVELFFFANHVVQCARNVTLADPTARAAAAAGTTQTKPGCPDNAWGFIRGTFEGS